MGEQLDMTKKLEQLLAVRHTRAKQTNGGGSHIFALKVRSGAGHLVKGQSNEFDAVAMHIWPSQKHDIDIYEIKSSRNDLRRELAQPWKAEAACAIADRFWLLTPPGLADGLQIPEHWGLVVSSTNNKQLVTKRAPKRLHAQRERPMARSFFVAMLQAEATILGKRPRQTKPHVDPFDNTYPFLTAEDDEPAEGSIVLDNYACAWQRRGNFWSPIGAKTMESWAYVAANGVELIHDGGTP